MNRKHILKLYQTENLCLELYKEFYRKQEENKLKLGYGSKHRLLNRKKSLKVMLKCSELRKWEFKKLEISSYETQND